MKRLSPFLCLFLVAGGLVAPPAAADLEGAKAAAEASIDSHGDELVGLADQVWAFAETALRETRSAAVLADYAESQGFAVERGVAGMPTAFVASYGSGRPIIAIMGEYDALPGISQKAQPDPEPLVEGAPGHGCGHNLFGAASLGAALAIKERIADGSIHGTVRFYGTPAEESVGGKLYMLRDGLFDDVDVMFAWHPSVEIVADTGSSQAMVDLVVEFHGRAAHAAYDPWNGRSAADAVEVFTHALNMMREHVKPSVRMHYVITHAGDVPNVVPAEASLWLWLRDSTHQGVNDLLARARDIVTGAALATGTTGTLRVQSGDWEMLPLFSGARLLHANATRLGPLEFTDEEQEFARRIQRNTGVPELGLRGAVKPLDLEPGEPEGGSTDVADVSWRVPTIHLSVTTAPVGAPWHGWPVVATGGMSIGHKGMLYAAKVLATTMADLYLDPDALAEVKAEFAEKSAGEAYVTYLPAGPPPLPTD
jgi:aminobenzoyl-glutamate utilization protein B